MGVINQEPILNEWIIFDVDKYAGDIWKKYLFLICSLSPYPMELWYAEGMRSPHLIVFVPELKNLEPEVREEYKKLFLKRYCPEADINLAEENRLISAREKIHFKHNSMKRLLGFWNKEPFEEMNNA